MDVEIKEHDDAIVLPYASGYRVGLYESSGHFVDKSCKRIYNGGGYAVQPDIAVGDYKLKKDSRRVLYFGYSRNHWGHFLIDEASRLWPLTVDGFKCDGIVVANKADCLVGFVKKFINYCGIEENRIIYVDEPTQFSKVYYGGLSYIVGVGMGKEYIDTFRLVANNVQKLHYASMDESYDAGGKMGRLKLYLSRSRLKTSGFRSEYGEKLLESILKKNGFQILHPESMGFEEQIHQYANADVMITTNGTLEHNVLFAPSEVSLLTINRFWEPGGNVHQNYINAFYQNAKVVNSALPESTHAVSLINMSDATVKALEELGVDCGNRYALRFMNWVETLKFLAARFIKGIIRKFRK